MSPPEKTLDRRTKKHWHAKWFAVVSICKNPGGSDPNPIQEDPMKPLRNELALAGLAMVVGIVAACSNGSNSLMHDGKGAVKFTMSASAAAPVAPAVASDGSSTDHSLQTANVTFASIPRAQPGRSAHRRHDRAANDRECARARSAVGRSRCPSDSCRRERTISSWSS
jgi:hypothetical protein